MTPAWLAALIALAQIGCLWTFARSGAHFGRMHGRMLATDAACTLAANARETSARSGALQKIAADLRAVQDDDLMSGPIPPKASRLIPALRREIAASVLDSLNAAPDEPPERIEPFLRGDIETSLHAVIPDAAAGPYGRSVEVRLRAVPGADDLAIAAVRMSTKCGDDTSLHVFRRALNKWTALTTFASRPSSSIARAWGSLAYSAESDGHGGFVIAVADVNPWCASFWQSLRYRVYRGSAAGVRELFADRRTIYIGVDDPVFELSLRGPRLQLRFQGDSAGEAGFIDEHRIVYEVRRSGVTRIAEVPRQKRRK